MINLGMVRPGRTIRIPFASFAASTGASSAMSGTATSDIVIYKDGSTTERASTSGYTFSVDFDTKTGLNVVTIDLADNTTAGFYTAGSEYLVGIADVTVDSQTVRTWIARFEIGYLDAVINTTIATLSSQTSFTLTSGPAENDALNGCVVCVHDVASAVQLGFGTVLAYVGSTKTVTLAAGVSFTAAAGDNVSLFAPSNSRWIGGSLQSATDLGEVATSAAEANSTVTQVQQVLNLLCSGSTPKIVGATGNDTTHIHLASVGTFGDDEINNRLLLIYDTSDNEYHSRWIEDFVGATDLATVDTLPFTPTTSDTYVLTGIRRDVLTESLAEIGQGAPPATADLESMIRYLYKAWRNKSDQTASTYQLYADDGTTVDHKRTVSDDGTTTTIGEVVSGP